VGKKKTKRKKKTQGEKKVRKDSQGIHTQENHELEEEKVTEGKQLERG